MSVVAHDTAPPGTPCREVVAAPRIVLGIMSSPRTDPDRDRASAPSDDVILEAARRRLLDVGWKRVTLTDVARRAGVSRMTIYRRWPDVRSLLADVMTREWAGMGLAVAETVHPEGADTATREDIVTSVMEVATAMRRSDLLTRIVQVDPEMLLPYVVERRGRTQELMIAALRPVIAGAQAGGTVRAGDPGRIAASIALACHGFVLSADTFTDLAEEEALAADLREMIDRFLRPA